MYSAYDGGKRDEALAAGVDAYVRKASLHMLQLLAEIERLAGPPTHKRHDASDAAASE
jgi:hypothetical protein